jgi:muramoyltetrapeptide carboxypeptidase
MNDIIGIVSPSTPLTPDLEQQFNSGVAFLESHGFRVTLGEHIRSTTDGYCASPQEKAADINRMFADDAIQGIFCSQGGVTANACLAHLDWDLICAHPKIFMGISDNTVLLNAIHHQTGLVTFHGNDVIWGFGRRPSDYDETEFISRLVEGRTGMIPPHDERRKIRAGAAEGKLLGGNLACLMKLAGTPYFPDFSGAILCLEACEIKPEACDHYFQQMKQIGVFDCIAGAVVGYVYSMQKVNPDKMQMEEVLLRVSQEYDFPILKTEDFGHNCSNTVLPIGSTVRIDADAGSIEIIDKYIL